jgi:hypothetical protein
MTEMRESCFCARLLLLPLAFCFGFSCFASLLLLLLLNRKMKWK